MSDTVIKVENLGKKYIIGHQKQERYTALRDVLANQVKSLGKAFRRNGKREDPYHEEFWALKDVSFEVKRGDRVGIIGRNGAGKSTLLKILSRITDPTEGRISIKGRVASLLEVGTGFHPELTGRENIFLNGAILGMSKQEITCKFDEIVAFAEVEKFLDTPVKRYSSGMYVRLAFAVAAHLEPEILIVDEVLAVGDAAFQKKCLGKMEDVAEKEGRTVLFVSHNMNTITSLCQKSILLKHGQIIKYGKSTDVITKYYLGLGSSTNHIDFTESRTIGGDSYARLISASVVDGSNSLRSEFLITEEVRIKMRFKILSDSSVAPLPAFDLHTAEGVYAFVCKPSQKTVPLQQGNYEFECTIPPNFLNEGTYLITLNLHSFNPTHLHFHEKEALSFTIRDPIVGTRNFDYTGPIAGVVRPKFNTHVIKID